MGTISPDQESGLSIYDPTFPPNETVNDATIDGSLGSPVSAPDRPESFKTVPDQKLTSRKRGVTC